MRVQPHRLSTLGNVGHTGQRREVQLICRGARLIATEQYLPTFCFLRRHRWHASNQIKLVSNGPQRLLKHIEQNARELLRSLASVTLLVGVCGSKVLSMTANPRMRSRKPDSGVGDWRWRILSRSCDHQDFDETESEAAVVLCSKDD